MATSWRRRVRKAGATATILSLALASCTLDPGEERSEVAVLSGGTLRVARVVGVTAFLTLDPQREYFVDAFELFRCCLLRTLLSYTGKPTSEGGAELRPDLASEMPDVSSDGLTWTFRMKRGLRYSPPFEDTEIVAQDIVRALDRKARLGQRAGYAFHYSNIEGFADVMNGRAGSISGLETPDAHTLIVQLTEPTGDLGFRMALPAAAPIPPSGQAPMGAAQGHKKNYGRFLVASGPYMIEGSEDVDFSLPSQDRIPTSGFAPGRELNLVRNPSWTPSSDRLRPAYPDRIEIKDVETREEAAEEVQRGAADLFLSSQHPPQLPADIMQRYRSAPALEDRLRFGSSDFIRYISMNLAIPPFDDIHVRKALNLVVDKAQMLEVSGGADTGEITGHAVLNSMQNNLLLNYDPYATEGSRGDADAARNEMAQSRYDDNGDGRCDARVCDRIRALAIDNPSSRRVAKTLVENAGAIGIDIDVRSTPLGALFRAASNPETRTPMLVNVAWLKDFPNAAGYITPLFSREGLAGPNYSLVGATKKELANWGYSVKSVPDLEDKIAECLPLVGDAQVRCWVEADQFLMERIVPWVPLAVDNVAYLLSSRVVSSSFDQFAGLPALDRIAISTR